MVYSWSEVGVVYTGLGRGWRRKVRNSTEPHAIRLIKNNNIEDRRLWGLEGKKAF